MFDLKKKISYSEKLKKFTKTIINYFCVIFTHKTCKSKNRINAFKT